MPPLKIYGRLKSSSGKTENQSEFKKPRWK